MNSQKNNRDLNIALGWAVVLLLVLLITDSIVVRLPVAAPLLFYWSGHVFLRAVGWSVPPIEHFVYAIACSIALTVGGGFLLNELSLLTPVGWAGWLLLVIGTGGLIARRRSEVGTVFVWRLPGMQRWHIIGVAVALVLVGGAYLLAVYDEARDLQFKYTEFWMLPEKRAPGKVIIGIKSAEAEPQVFNLLVSAQVTPEDTETPIISDGTTPAAGNASKVTKTPTITDGTTPAAGNAAIPAETPTVVPAPQLTVIAQLNDIEIAPGDTWTQEINIGIGYKKAEARLYRVSDHSIYRRVSAILPTGKK